MQNKVRLGKTHGWLLELSLRDKRPTTRAPFCRAFERAAARVPLARSVCTSCHLPATGARVRGGRIVDPSVRFDIIDFIDGGRGSWFARGSAAQRCLFRRAGSAARAPSSLRFWLAFSVTSVRARHIRLRATVSDGWRAIGGVTSRAFVPCSLPLAASSQRVRRSGRRERYVGASDPSSLALSRVLAARCAFIRSAIPSSTLIRLERLEGTLGRVSRAIRMEARRSARSRAADSGAHARTDRYAREGPWLLTDL